ARLQASLALEGPLMRTAFLRFHFFLLAVPLTLGLVAGACDDDSNNSPTAVAPREPGATAGEEASPILGFLGRTNTLNGPVLGIGPFDVVVNDETHYFRNGRASSLSSFAIGEMVRVAGAERNSQTIVATKISLL